MLVIGSKNGSSSSRKQKEFPTEAEGRQAIREWAEKGFNTFWVQVGDEDLKYLHPFTIIRDWSADWWDERSVSARSKYGEEPQLFHVWAETGSDASDEVERQIIHDDSEHGETVLEYLNSVAVLIGHAEFASN